MKKLLFIIVLIIISCTKNDDQPISTDKPSEQKTINLIVNGINRSFVVYLPSKYNNVGKMPMVFLFHGGSGTGDDMIKLADFRAIAEREKVVLVYPNGYQNSWNDGRLTDANVAGINDVAFVNNMIDYMIANYPIENKKVYATGMSNGGFMSSRLACELSNKITAIAVVAATIEQTSIAANCNPTNTVPAIYIHGTLDGFVPILGGTVPVDAGGNVLSHVQAITKWITINNCSATPVVTDLPDIANDGTTIKKRVYTNPTTGVEVVSYIVANGGHTWPQGYQYLAESIIGKTSLDMNANETIWEFFKKYSR